MRELKVTVGNSASVTLTEEELEHLKVKEGDTLCLTKTADNSYVLSRERSEFARQMELVERIMRRDHKLLRALAK